MIGKAIYAILSGASGLTDLVGTNIFPKTAPQSRPTPFVVYAATARRPSNFKGGAGVIDLHGVQIDTYAKTYSAAHDIAAQIRDALDNYKGTAGGVTVRRAWLENEEDADFVADLGFFGVSQDYLIRQQR